MGQYEFGNLLAERWGASVKRDFYKHSHIRYKGLVVENHQFCTAIRGSRRAKDFERLCKNAYITAILYTWVILCWKHLRIYLMLYF